MNKTNPVFIVGPTAVGKTSIAIALAKAFDAEIISADSMQIYRGMDIGTAKPSASQLKEVPHHLINLLSLDETFSAAKFKSMAERIISEIQMRSRVPLVVGGTGLYVKTLTEGIFEGPSADWEYRAKLQSEEEKHGSGHLYEELSRIDPISAQRIKQNDMRRIIRALEIYYLTGKQISELQTEWEINKPDITIIGLEMERRHLNERINERVDEMFSKGLIDETKRLLDAGIESNHTAMQAIGYKEVIGYIHGKYPIEHALELLKRNSRRYAKRQLTWFRRDNRIKWFNVGTKLFDELLYKIRDYLKSRGY